MLSNVLIKVAFSAVWSLTILGAWGGVPQKKYMYMYVAT